LLAAVQKGEVIARQAPDRLAILIVNKDVYNHQARSGPADGWILSVRNQTRKHKRENRGQS
jgi:hypothetical protein